MVLWVGFELLLVADRRVFVVLPYVGGASHGVMPPSTCLSPSAHRSDSPAQAVDNFHHICISITPIIYSHYFSVVFCVPSDLCSTSAVSGAVDAPDAAILEMAAAALDGRCDRLLVSFGCE